MPRPSPNQVRLRIAGMYYDQVFDIEELRATAGQAGNAAYFPNIEDLHKTAKNKATTPSKLLAYDSLDIGSGDLSLNGFITQLSEEINSIGGQPREAGVYLLKEFVVANTVVAWQYYVYRDGISISQFDRSSKAGYSPADTGSPSAGGFTPYNKFELNKFASGEPAAAFGDEVIWRMVAIQREPVIKDVIG